MSQQQTNRPRITKLIPPDEGLSGSLLPYTYMMGDHHSMTRVSYTSSAPEQRSTVLQVTGAGVFQYGFIACQNNDSVFTNFGGEIVIDDVLVYDQKNGGANPGTEGALHPVGATFWGSNQQPFGMYLASHYFDKNIKVTLYASRPNVGMAFVYKYYLMVGNVDTGVLTG